MIRSSLFDRLAICAALLGVSVSFAACSDDVVPPPAAAGTGAAAVGGGAAGTLPAAGTAAPVAGTAAPTGTGGIGMMPSPVTGAGTGAAGTGAAGMAGTLAGGTGAAGTGMAVAAGTGGAGTGMAGTGAPAFTPGSPTFSAIYQEIIVAKGCNGGPTCHASTAAGQLKMTNKMESFTALVGVKAAGMNLVMNGTPNCKDSNLMRVMAGNPEASLLFKKVNSAMPECGGKMPPAGAMLSPAMLDQIRMWIMNGAKDD